MRITARTRPVKRTIFVMVNQSLGNNLDRTSILKLTLMAVLFNTLNRSSDYERRKYRFGDG